MLVNGMEGGALVAEARPDNVILGSFGDRHGVETNLVIA